MTNLGFHKISFKKGILDKVYNLLCDENTGIPFLNFYFTDEKASFLIIYFKDNNILYASGEAREWLQQYKTLQYDESLRTLDNVFELLDFKASKISILDFNLLLHEINGKYGDSKEIKWPLCEHIASTSILITNDDGWLWIKEYIENDEVILFFDPDESDVTGFIFPESQELMKYLDVAPWDDIYVTNKNRNYLLSFNSYKNLQAWGDAKEWLKILKTK